MTPVKPRTRVLVLQHPDEQRHPFNTARLAIMSLAGSRCMTGEVFPELAQVFATARYPVLLFPGHKALAPTSWRNNMADKAPGSCAAKEGMPLPDLLVVPDGTWRQASRIVRLNPLLATLPRAGLPPGEPSAYQIRRSHRPGAVSTLEAIVRTLSAFEPTTDFQPVLSLFDKMVALQLQTQQRLQRQGHHSQQERLNSA